MKVIYITKPVQYNKALALAADRNYQLADYRISEAVIHLIENTDGHHSIDRRGYLTSTTYQYDSFKFVYPCDNIEIAQSEQSQMIEEKTSKRMAILIPGDFTLKDVEHGEFVIYRL